MASDDIPDESVPAAAVKPSLKRRAPTPDSLESDTKRLFVERLETNDSVKTVKSVKSRVRKEKNVWTMDSDDDDDDDDGSSSSEPSSPLPHSRMAATECSFHTIQAHHADTVTAHELSNTDAKKSRPPPSSDVDDDDDDTLQALSWSENKIRPQSWVVNESMFVSAPALPKRPDTKPAPVSTVHNPTVSDTIRNPVMSSHAIHNPASSGSIHNPAIQKLLSKTELKARFKELYPGMDTIMIKNYPRDRPRFDQYHKLKPLVNRNWELLRRQRMATGQLHLDVENHSSLAKSVFNKVTAWRHAIDKGTRNGRIPPLPAAEEILAIKLLSNSNQHHKCVLNALQGTSMEYLLEPIPSFYGFGKTTKPAPSNPAGAASQAEQPRPSIELAASESECAPAPASVAHHFPVLSRAARDKFTGLGILKQRDHYAVPDARCTLDSLVSETQVSVFNDVGKSLGDKLRQLQEQQDKARQKMSVLHSAYEDIKALQAKQDSAVADAVDLLQTWQMQSGFVTFAAGRDQAPASASHGHHQAPKHAQQKPTIHRGQGQAARGSHRDRYRPSPPVKLEYAPWSNTAGDCSVWSGDDGRLGYDRY